MLVICMVALLVGCHYHAKINEATLKQALEVCKPYSGLRVIYIEGSINDSFVINTAHCVDGKTITYATKSATSSR